MKFTYPLTILETHLDTFGHMNNATYLQLFEQARWEIITERGFGLKVIQEKQIGPVILEIHIRFIKELKLRQKVNIVTTVEEYSGKIGKLKQVMEDESGEVYTEAIFTLGFFDMRLRKLIPPTKEWLNALGIQT